MSGNRVTFLGDAMAAVVQGVEEVRNLIGQPPVVIGGLAVMCRLSTRTALLLILILLTGCAVKCRSFRCCERHEMLRLSSLRRCCCHPVRAG